MRASQSSTSQECEEVAVECWKALADRLRLAIVERWFLPALSDRFSKNQDSDRDHSFAFLLPSPHLENRAGPKLTSPRSAGPAAHGSRGTRRLNGPRWSNAELPMLRDTSPSEPIVARTSPAAGCAVSMAHLSLMAGIILNACADHRRVCTIESQRLWSRQQNSARSAGTHRATNS